MRIHASFEGRSETELPVDVLSFNFELGTGAVVVDDIMALATAAADTVLSMAVLPVNEDDERVVENLMRRTRSTSTSSPL